MIASSAVRVHTMRDMTPTVSASEGASLKVEEMTYSGDVPISPVQHITVKTEAQA